MASVKDPHRVDVRLVALRDDRMLLVSRPGHRWNVLPGGLVTSGERVESALARHVRVDHRSLVERCHFVAAVEHDDAKASGSPHSGNVLSLVFATEWPATSRPLHVEGELVEVHTDALLAVRLAPRPVGWAVRRWLTESWPIWRGLRSSASDPDLHPSVTSLRAQLAARREQLRSRRFRDAAVAVSALVTAADGYIDPAEIDGFEAFVATDPVMSYFSTDDLRTAFQALLADLMRDFNAGKQSALAEIAKVRGRSVQAAAVVRLGIVLGGIDGEFVSQEQAVVAEVAQHLGFDPADFGLPASP
ncbi:TerB family tellurite resistance protein [Frankia sp. CcI49]|uniref:TerB family tellurite resistance protein n=1 Tax=Frankia sp. CcI49 TaxID=1745382 RepID=UPI000A0132E7|nr:TerB family tellurite resistance protein [Frankia sp. CcI49]